MGGGGVGGEGGRSEAGGGRRWEGPRQLDPTSDLAQNSAELSGCCVKVEAGGGPTSWAPVPNKPTVSVDVKQHFSQNNLTDPDLECLRAGPVQSVTAAFSVRRNGGTDFPPSAGPGRQQQRSPDSRLERKSVPCSQFSRPLGFGKSVSVAMLMTV